MSRKTDKISSLIDPLYFNWIREAVIKHGRINIQALSEKFGILPGNTYFRNFIKDKKQDYLGSSGLINILNTYGYTIKLVPIKKDDLKTLTDIEKSTKEAFADIRDTVSALAEGVKKAPIVKKNKGQKIIKKANLINDSILGISESVDVEDMFDDDLEVGAYDPNIKMPVATIDPSLLTKMINKDN
jgi:hypothetical protein